MPAMPGPRGWLLLAAALTIAVDRLTKVLATTFLAGTPTRSYLGGAVQLEYAMNPGAFLGLGGNWPAGVRLAVFAGATAIGLLIVYLLSSRLRARPALLGLGGILGGS